MWSQPPQWLQASHYQNVPHNQVDWATLAKQWISLQQQPPPHIPLPPTGPPPPPPPPPLPPPSMQMFGLPEIPPPDVQVGPWSSGSHEAADTALFTRNVEPNVSHSEPSPWEQGVPNFTSRQVVDYAHGPSSASRTSGVVMDYGHGDGPAAGERCVVDYAHGYSHDSTTPPTNTQDSEPSGTSSSSLTNAPTGNTDSNMALDAIKRKNLPAWIRDGLEKMEREKQRKKDAEEASKERNSGYKKPLWAQEDDEQEDSKKASINETSKAPESDEELPDDETTVVEREPVRPARSIPPPIILTPEEKEHQFALNVKRFMTEILMSVITTELNEIVDEELSRARHRVTAKPKKVTSALANIVGLSGYSDSEASDNEVAERQNDSDSDLESKVAARRKEFDRWEESRLRTLEEKESNQQKRLRREQSGRKSSSERSKSDSPERSRDKTHRLNEAPESSKTKDKIVNREFEGSNDSNARSMRLKDERKARKRDSSSSDSDSSDNDSKKSSKRSHHRSHHRRSKSRDRSVDFRRSGSRDDRKRSTSRDRRRDRSRERSRHEKSRKHSRSRDKRSRRDRSRSRSRDKRRRDRSRSREYQKSSHDSKKYDRSHRRR